MMTQSRASEMNMSAAVRIVNCPTVAGHKECPNTPRPESGSGQRDLLRVRSTSVPSRLHLAAFHQRAGLGAEAG